MMPSIPFFILITQINAFITFKLLWLSVKHSTIVSSIKLSMFTSCHILQVTNPIIKLISIQMTNVMSAVSNQVMTAFEAHALVF